jgi:hypothetical protein
MLKILEARYFLETYTERSITGPILSCIGSYIDIVCRRRCFRFGECQSAVTVLWFGVQQGTIHGPLFSPFLWPELPTSSFRSVSNASSMMITRKFVSV